MELGDATRDGLCCEEQEEEDHEDCSNNPMSREAVEKEHMFDKVLTPSDVGKLNRLVIPKQQAEKHFPLDASASEKGLLLSFEDRHGKPWPFRYSYWNSSQSYVMTKGWSRFVKEKRLDAGGTVSFARGVGESATGRLFIDWKRRPEVHDLSRLQPPMVSFSRSLWAGRVLVPTVASAVTGAVPTAYRNAAVYRSVVAPPPVQLQPAGVNAAFAMPMVQQAAAKRVRLFGVNLDFQASENPQGNEQQQSLDLDSQ